MYKKRFVLGLLNYPPVVEIPLRLNNSLGGNFANDFVVFMNLVEEQPDADKLTKYIQDNFCPCNACNGTKKAHERCQMWLDIDGKRRLAAICDFGISRIKHGSRREPYTDYDKIMLKRMLDLRFAQIDNEVNI